MADNINIDISKELSILQNELEKIDELYDETKEHYDKVKNSGSNGTLTFIEKQTSNLISLKTGKISIIQQIVNAKKTEADIALKNQRNQEGGDNSDIREIVAGVHDYILNNKKDKKFSEIINKQESEDISGSQKNDEEVDALLEARLKEEQNESNSEKEETVIEEKINDYQYVVDMEKNIYCLDGDYNIIEDAEIPDLQIEITEENGEYIAKDENGKIYDVVEFTEDEE
ncbi:hypothetical protein AR9_g142 [Bacillus phage AR9]|uniref:Uncharacterized protein n=2 Tax=Bacillus phage PBS1 TaxID=10683 RepID=A0A172JI49_BPPB1|nr:hypothetical protein BI022_gp141 [Bacillus phage AR9]YP_009664231.1 hypothetical protein FK780_gp029 [Bacillus phage PBS1]AMS01226.1 hypothetical protein AR9_g142 [Bacillus phage AR9]AST99851.1 hypothetical protein PBI_PBS1_29 [Bacillus phage PBS1]BDE75329.1 hypothetical protein [Bacillus phage PBS1]